MDSSTQRFALGVLRAASAQLPADFAGLGVIFYATLDELSFLGLDVPPVAEIPLPVSGQAAIATALARVSSVRSGWHDGFHFVDVRREALSHLAQFVSPPLPQLPATAPAAAGARHMTAALASRVRGIHGCGILTSRSELAYFSNGRCVAHERLG